MNLIDICYDCRSGIRGTPAIGHLDIDRTVDQFLGLRNVLEDLFRAATTPQATRANSMAVASLMSPQDTIGGLLIKCRNEVDELESALDSEQVESGNKGNERPFSLETTLSNLALSIGALRGVIDGGRQ